ncbi:MAG: DUF456 domain-containing protein [Candidatus Cryptobacteroides sp.]|nr:DUF456 domain-containing protein [Candidatus Cryptobacteroides sp.]
MSTFLIILAVILGVVGIIGSIVPGLPGPPLSWLGLLLAYFAGGTNAAGDPITMKFLIIWLAVTTIVTILDYFVPAWFTKLTGGSKYAGRGAIAGLIIGMIVPPVGVIIGSLAGAFLAELIYGQKDAPDSLKSAFGAFLGFLFGTGVKLIAAGLMMYYIIVYI